MFSKKMNYFFEVFCKVVFGHNVTPALKEFAGHISWSLAGGLIAAGILLITNVLAGRLLGAEEYGKYSIIFTIAQILIVLLLFGMDLSVARSLAMRLERVKQTADISAAFVLVFIVGGLVILVFTILHKEVVSLFRVDPTLLFAAVFLGTVLALRQFLDSVMRGISWFKLQSLARIAEALLIMGLFLIAFYFFHEETFLGYVVPLFVGGVFLCFAYVYMLRHYFARFDRETLQNLVGYGKIAFLAGLLGIIFGSLDKIAIARYLSFHDLGIYSAYYTVSFIIVAQVGALFDNVFFPTIAKFKDDLTPIIKKVDRLSILFFVPFFLGMCAVIYVLLRLFGNGYPIVWIYIFGFGLIATLKMILIVNTSLITAHSKESLTFGLVYGNSVNVVFIFIFFLFLNFFHLSILFMVYFLIAYTAAFIFLNKWILYRVGFYQKDYVSN